MYHKQCPDAESNGQPLTAFNHVRTFYLPSFRRHSCFAVLGSSLQRRLGPGLFWSSLALHRARFRDMNDQALLCSVQ